MVDVFRGKRFVVVYNPETNDVTIGADDLEEVLISIRGGRMRPQSQAVPSQYGEEEPVPPRVSPQRQAVPPSYARPAQPAARRPQPDFLGIDPNSMTQQVWDGLSNEQREMWMQTWDRQK